MLGSKSNLNIATIIGFTLGVFMLSGCDDYETSFSNVINVKLDAITEQYALLEEFSESNNLASSFELKDALASTEKFVSNQSILLMPVANIDVTDQVQNTGGIRYSVNSFPALDATEDYSLDATGPINIKPLIDALIRSDNAVESLVF